MRNSRWKQADGPPGEYTQLKFFPPTGEEILKARVTELEEKLDRQRKSQFGKIGAQEKRLRELTERFVWIEKWICENNFQPANSECEILEMVGQ